MLKARDRRDLERVLSGEPGNVEIWDTEGAIDFAALQHRDASGNVGHEQHADAVEIGFALLPIFVIPLEERVFALGIFRLDERSGADDVAAEAFFALLLVGSGAEDAHGAVGQVRDQAADGVVR